MERLAGRFGQYGTVCAILRKIKVRIDGIKINEYFLKYASNNDLFEQIKAPAMPGVDYHHTRKRNTRIHHFDKGGLKMKRESKFMLTLIIIMIAVFFTTGCSTLRHKYIMRGQILDASNGEVYLCIGTKDGASVGQVVDVYKFVKGNALPHGDKSGFVFVKEKTGTVKIIEVTDHYAKAAVISGTAKENSLVELEK